MGLNARRLPSKTGEDRLAEPWDAETIYVNPPYGTDSERGTRIIHWFAKIAEAVSNGSEVIALAPVATNTRHWKQFVYPLASAICFLYEPRVKFLINGEEDPKGAPMSIAAIYYGDNPRAFANEFCQHGAVISMQGIALPSAYTVGKLL